MTEQEFLDSLKPAQAKFYNDRLISVRSELQSMFASTEQSLIEAHSEIANSLASTRNLLQKSLEESHVEASRLASDLKQANAIIDELNLKISAVRPATPL